MSFGHWDILCHVDYVNGVDGGGSSEVEGRRIITIEEEYYCCF